MKRRTLFGLAAIAAAGPAGAQIQRRTGTHLKVALNAYSFNKPLTAGTMKLDDLIDYCATHDIDGVDLTGYYFPGYPAVPPDEFLYAIKKRAYLNGVTINGTGVRNDFATADAAARKTSVELVKNWIVAAEKMGAAVVRVFSGPRLAEGKTLDAPLKFVTSSSCAPLITCTTLPAPARLLAWLLTEPNCTTPIF